MATDPNIPPSDPNAPAGHWGAPPGYVDPRFQGIADWLKANPGGRYTGGFDPQQLQSWGSGATTGGTNTTAYKQATLNTGAYGKIIPYSQLPGSPGYNPATDPYADIWSSMGISATGQPVPGVGQPGAAPGGANAIAPQTGQPAPQPGMAQVGQTLADTQGQPPPQQQTSAPPQQSQQPVQQPNPMFAQPPQQPMQAGRPVQDIWRQARMGAPADQLSQALQGLDMNRLQIQHPQLFQLIQTLLGQGGQL